RKKIPSRIRLPDRANALGFQALDRVQDHAPGARRVRRQVEASEDAVDEEAFGIEHFLELGERVRTHGRGELPRALPVDDHLARLEPAPEQIERCVLKDDRPVVQSLPSLSWQPRDEAIAGGILSTEL